MCIGITSLWLKITLGAGRSRFILDVQLNMWPWTYSHFWTYFLICGTICRMLSLKMTENATWKWLKQWGNLFPCMMGKCRKSAKWGIDNVIEDISTLLLLGSTFILGLTTLEAARYLMTAIENVYTSLFKVSAMVGGWGSGEKDYFPLGGKSWVLCWLEDLELLKASDRGMPRADC